TGRPGPIFDVAEARRTYNVARRLEDRREGQRTAGLLVAQRGVDVGERLSEAVGDVGPAVGIARAVRRRGEVSRMLARQRLQPDVLTFEGNRTHRASFGGRQGFG